MNKNLWANLEIYFIIEFHFKGFITFAASN
jgi:hypothetical protein